MRQTQPIAQNSSSLFDSSAFHALPGVGSESNVRYIRIGQDLHWGHRAGREEFLFTLINIERIAQILKMSLCEFFRGV
jgi:hypothetical protein